MLFGAVGTGYFVYAKRQQAIIPAICGVGLLVVPYLVSNTYAMLAVCLVLTAGPWLLDEPF